MRGWPLATLHRVRRRAEAGAREVLAAACAGEARARAEREALGSALAAHARVRERAERDACWGGEVAELQRGARHLRRLRAEEAVLAGRRAEADARLVAASEDASRARCALATARRAVEQLDRRREAWAKAMRGRFERAEEAAEDDRGAGRGEDREPSL
jgi:hypothetical protein